MTIVRVISDCAQNKHMHVFFVAATQQKREAVPFCRQYFVCTGGSRWVNVPLDIWLAVKRSRLKSGVVHIWETLVFGKALEYIEVTIDVMVVLVVLTNFRRRSHRKLLHTYCTRHLRWKRKSWYYDSLTAHRKTEYSDTWSLVDE
jgi:hypothetical protein